MTQPLAGHHIALAEGRQLEELATMLEQEGATTLRCPLLSILDAPDSRPVDLWIDELIGSRFNLAILMTGEAVHRLVGFAERSGRRDLFLKALTQVPKLTRGPKPGKALREYGITDAETASAPTTEGVITSLEAKNLAGASVGLTLYGSPNPRLVDYLLSRTAQVSTVLSYILAPSIDADRVGELITQLDQGEVACVVFTSSPQVERLWEVARQRQLETPLLSGLGKTKVAAVGPLVAESLRTHGAPVHICPDQGWQMKNLVRQIVRAITGG